MCGPPNKFVRGGAEDAGADAGAEVVGGFWELVDPVSFDRLTAEKGELVVAVEDDKLGKLGNAGLDGAVVDGAEVGVLVFELEPNPPLMVNRLLPELVSEPRFEEAAGAVAEAELWPPDEVDALLGGFSCEVDGGGKLKGDFIPPEVDGAVPNREVPED